MSTPRDKHIHYRDNDWNNIVTNFNLNNNIEVVMHGQDSPDNSVDSTNKMKAKSWLFRSFVLTSIVAILGNIPLQSHLSASTNSNIKSFELTPELESGPKLATKKSVSTPIIDTESTNQHTKSDNTLVDFQELALPKKAIETYVDHIDTNNNRKWTTYQVKSYDNLTNIFYKLGHQSILKTIQQNDVLKKELASLEKGSIICASSVDGKLSKLVFTHNKKDGYVITLNDGKYSGKWKKSIFEIRQSRANFTIKNGLFFDGRKAGIPNNIIKQVVKAFDWDIDFSQDVRVGDEVTAVFEEIYHDGDKVGNRHLLAAEFINKGRDFKAIRYAYKDGKSGYFTPQGREMKTAFIRRPIPHARVSSPFNLHRLHPVLHKIRPHLGTDFAARRGTPIMATGNGIIKSIGRKGGYGRTIIIQHREGYTSIYAHMSRFKKKLKIGSKVYQGDVIGYVGSSGISTGPHLHYEFRLNNKALDPMHASLPHSMSLSSRELKDFRSKAINLVLQLNVLHRFAKAKIDINTAIGG